MKQDGRPEGHLLLHTSFPLDDRVLRLSDSGQQEDTGKNSGAVRLLSAPAAHKQLMKFIRCGMQGRHY